MIWNSIKISIFYLILFSANSIANTDSIPYFESKLNTKNEIEKVKILIKLSQLYENIKLSKAVEFSLEAKNLATKLNDPKSIAASYLIYADQVIRFEKYDSVLTLKTKACEILSSIGEEHLAANAMIEVAKSALVLHQYSKTNQYIQNAVKIFAKFDDNVGYAKAYTLLGQLYGIFNLNDIAIEYYNNAIQIYENTGNNLEAQKIYAMKNIQRLLNKDKSVISDLHYSATVFKNSTEFMELIIIYRGIADYYYTFEKNYSLASKYLDSAVNLSSKMGDHTMTGILLTQYAWMYRLEGNLDKELEYGFKAIDIRKKSGYSILYASAHINIAETFLRMKNWDSCEYYLKTGLAMLGDTNSNHFTKRAFNLYYRFYLAQNNLTKALYYRNKEIDVEHHIQATDNVERLNSLKIQLQLAESEKNLNILKQEKVTTLNIMIITAVFIILSSIAVYYYKFKKREKKQKTDSILFENNSYKKLLFEDQQIQTPGIIYIYNPVDHTCNILSDNILAELGYHNNKVENSTQLFWGLMKKEDEFHFIDSLENNTIGYQDNSLILEFRLKDYFGDYRNFRSANKLFSDDNSDSRKIIGFAVEVTDYKKYEEIHIRQIALVKGINHFFDTITNLKSNKDIYIRTADKIREITGAALVSISTYDEVQNTLTPQYISVESNLLKKINNALGMNIEKMSFPVTEKSLNDLRNKRIRMWEDIFEPAGGVISSQIAGLLKDMFSVREILGLPMTYNDEVIGAMIVVMRNVRMQIEPEILRIYTNFASYAINNLKCAEMQNNEK